MGISGSLRLSGANLKERFLLLNGDTRFNVNLFNVALHSDGALATLALRRETPVGRYGTVEVGDDGRIQGFTARSAGRSGPANGGI